MIADTPTESTDVQGEEVVSESTSDWGKMTPEEREADVDALVKEATEPKSEAEEEPEPKTETPGDGDETPADADAVEEEGDETPSGEGEAEDEEEEAPADWLDDEVRGLASTMGLTNDDLEGLSSRDEFDRVLRILDRNVVAAGKAAKVASAEEEAPPPAEEPPETPPKAAGAMEDLSKFKIGEEFDPEVAKPLNDFMEAVGAELGGVTKALAGLLDQQKQAAADTVYRQAVESLHTLGHADLFGEPGKPATDAQTANINKAIDAHLIHAQVLAAKNKSAPPTPEFLKAAVRMEFGDQIFKKEQRQRTEKLKKQSARRSGGMPSKTVERPNPNLELVDRIKSDPELDKLFNDLVSERSG